MKIKLKEPKKELDKAWASVVKQIKPLVLEREAAAMKDIAQAWLDFANLLEEYKQEATERYKVHSKKRNKRQTKSNKIPQALKDHLRRLNQMDQEYDELKVM